MKKLTKLRHFVTIMLGEAQPKVTVDTSEFMTMPRIEKNHFNQVT